MLKTCMVIDDKIARQILTFRWEIIESNLFFFKLKLSLVVYQKFSIGYLLGTSFKSALKSVKEPEKTSIITI